MSEKLDLDALERLAELTRDECDQLTGWPAHVVALIARVRELEQAAASDLREIPLGIIRKWPDGFGARWCDVMKDLQGFIPDYCLYDLSRVAAEYGFTLRLHERAPEGEPK